MKTKGKFDPRDGKSTTERIFHREGSPGYLWGFFSSQQIPLWNWPGIPKSAWAKNSKIHYSKAKRISKMAPKGQSCSPHFQRKTWNDFILIPHFPRNLIPHFLWKTWNGSILIPHFLRNLIPHFSRKTWNGSILIPHFPRNLIPRFLRRTWNGFTLIPHFLRNSTLLKEGLEWFYFNSSSPGMGRARGKKVRKFHFQSQSKAGRIPGEGTSGILWLTHFLLSLPQLFALEWKLPTDWDVPSIYKKIRDKKNIPMRI